MVLAAVGQLCSTANITNNLRQCQTLVRKAVAANAKALFLPEASDYIASSPEETISLVKSVQDSDFVRGIQAEAKAARLPISVGVHEPVIGGGKVKNTLLWIDEEGQILHRYQKLHLFDVDVPGGPNLKESRSVERGTTVTPPFETALGRIGMAICFDLRFPELSLALNRLGAEILTYPSAFAVITGQAHWEPLLRARAIESQAYVIAAAQAGFHNDKRASYGHSMVVDPWGKVLAELDDSSEPEIITADIDIEVVRKVRAQIPLYRRTEVYAEV